MTSQVVVAYLCDCCLGWVFYRKAQGAAKATCEGAVLFFRHGKTLARNLGRVFGMGSPPWWSSAASSPASST